MWTPGFSSDPSIHLRRERISIRRWLCVIWHLKKSWLGRTAFPVRPQLTHVNLELIASDWADPLWLFITFTELHHLQLLKLSEPLIFKCHAGIWLLFFLPSTLSQRTTPVKSDYMPHSCSIITFNKKVPQRSIKMKSAVHPLCLWLTSFII